MTTQLNPTGKGQLVLLFYDGFEWRARHKPLDRLAAQARRHARFAWRTLRRKQVYTGFYTAFLALRTALERQGCDVRVNDFVTATRHPHYPIGIAGYPSVLNAVDLPNPKIFGPGDFGPPRESVAVAANADMKLLIQPSDWFRDYYRPFAGDKVVTWFAGIDTDRWRDRSTVPKSIDVLIYDKIHWHRDARVPAVLDRLTHHLDQRGLSWSVVRYGQYRLAAYAQKLSAARSIAFLSQHETQGLAYQEAMAVGVPVFAWDEGEFGDPLLNGEARAGLNVSSVPYFDERCGERFVLSDLEPRFDEFWGRLGSYRPRDYVCENLSLAQSAEAYLKLYRSIA